MEEDAMMPRDHDDSDSTIAIRAEFQRHADARPWLVRHPAIAVSVLGGLFGVVLSGVQVYTSSMVSEAVAEEQTKTYRNETKEEIGDVKEEITTLKNDAAKEHSSMRTSVRDVGILSIEQGRSNRTILEDLAKRRGVKVKDKGDKLKAAEKKVEGLPSI